MSVEHYLLDKLKERIQLARRIDAAQHKIKKENHEKNWLKEAAAAMEIEVDSDMGLRLVSRSSPRPLALTRSRVSVTMTVLLLRYLRSTSAKLPMQKQPFSRRS